MSHVEGWCVYKKWPMLTTKPEPDPFHFHWAEQRKKKRFLAFLSLSPAMQKPDSDHAGADVVGYRMMSDQTRPSVSVSVDEVARTRWSSGDFTHSEVVHSSFVQSEPVVKRSRHLTVDALRRRNLRIISVVTTFLLATGLVVLVTFLSEPAVVNATGRAWIVESLPVGDFDAIQELPGVKSSWRTLIEMINTTQSTLDVTVMYWDLLASNSTDAPYFTPAQFKAFGADWGQQMLDAFDAAAGRGVQIRFVQSYSASQLPYEMLWLQNQHPKSVSIYYWNADDWFDGGIMHQKLWISDNKNVYIGSANMDWKSLAQVKELGVYIESEAVAADLTTYFENWVEWCSINHPGVSSGDATVGSAVAWSTDFDLNLTKPCWSKLVPSDDPQKCSSPLTPHDTFTFSNPMPISLNGTHSAAFISGSPQEVLGDATTAGFCAPRDGDNSWRVNGGDGDAFVLNGAASIVKTILDADSFVGLSVMDFIPTSLYDGGHSSDGEQQPVWWPAFIDPLIAASYGRGVNVKLLISKWAHTNSKIAQYLEALNATASICSEPAKYTKQCRGSFEIRLFEVPGWNETTGKDAKWPSYTRVNHAKYVVTDKRVNIGTSNHAWGYFYNTAGASFNSNNTELQKQLSEIFMRDWNSPYAHPL